MAIKPSNLDLPLRAKDVAYDAISPGLYPGEALLDVDGVMVAVSVKSSWLDTGAGVGFQSWARVVRPDGRTRTGPEGQHVETTASFTAAPALVALHGIEAISREMLLAVLGEPLTQVAVPVEDGVPESAPLIGWPDDWLLSVSIRHALATVPRTKPEAKGDPIALLGLAGDS